MIEHTRIEAAYLPPDHLRAGGSIGPIPQRTFYVLLAAFLAGSLPLSGLAGLHGWGVVGALLLASLPLLLVLPFALPVFDPPAEHGLLRST